MYTERSEESTGYSKQHESFTYTINMMEVHNKVGNKYVVITKVSIYGCTQKDRNKVRVTASSTNHSHIHQMINYYMMEVHHKA